MWIGWTGNATLQGRDLKSLITEFAKREGYRVAPVPLTTEDYERFYQGFCNEIIWPLFHDLQSHCNFVPDVLDELRRRSVQTFADVVQKHAQAGRPDLGAGLSPDGAGAGVAASAA